MSDDKDTLKFALNHDVNEEHLHIIERILENDSDIPILISGDTGIGKTSFVKQVAKLFGVTLIVIEAPSIIEEHIINIPFLVKRSDSDKTSSFNVNIQNETDYKVVLANSALYAQLGHGTEITDGQLLKRVYADNTLVALWEKIGGTKTAVPDDIKEFRGKHNTLLFVDEFLRTQNITIQNMLREIVNGRLGTHDIPDNVFVLLASNTFGKGVNSKSDNMNVEATPMKVASPDVWFSFFYNKHKKDKDLNITLLNTIYDFLKSDSYLSMTEHGVRISPRRWEQMVLYVNANLPVKDIKQANLLFKNIHNSFIHHLTGDELEAGLKFVEILKTFVKDTYQIEGSHTRVADEDWRETVDHQIKTKIKIGKDRTYVPIVSGIPGIGKTEFIAKLARDNNLVPIAIESTSFQSTDEIIGIPLSSSDKETKDISVAFSPPPLYTHILNLIEVNTSRYIKALNESDIDKDIIEKRLKDFNSAQYKYLIFFDELNRVRNEAVFNALRRVLLEKEFNNEYSIPESAIMVGAINPSGTKGTIQFTEHTVDAIDIIPAKVDWDQFKAVIKSMKVKNDTHDIKNVLLDFVETFLNHFKPTDEEVEAKYKKFAKRASSIFYISTANGLVYINPRQLKTFIKQGIRTLNRLTDDLISKLSTFSDPTIPVNIFKNKAFKLLRGHILLEIQAKLEQNTDNFLDLAGDWITSDAASGMFTSIDDLFMITVKTTQSLLEMLQAVVDNQKKNHLCNNQDFYHYITGVDPNEFKKDINAALKELFHVHMEKLGVDRNSDEPLEYEKGRKVNHDFFHNPDVAAVYETLYFDKDKNIKVNKHKTALPIALASEIATACMHFNVSNSIYEVAEEACKTVFADEYVELYDKRLEPDSTRPKMKSGMSQAQKDAINKKFDEEDLHYGYGSVYPVLANRSAEEIFKLTKDEYHQSETAPKDNTDMDYKASKHFVRKQYNKIYKEPIVNTGENLDGDQDYDLHDGEMVTPAA